MTTRFLTQFAAFALASFAVLFGLRAAFGEAVVHPLAPWLLGGLLALTLAGYLATAWATARSADNFLGAYFGGVGLRLLLAIGVMVAYFRGPALRDNHGLLTFLGAFFLAYFCCAGFEIWAIFRNLRPFSGGQAPKSA